MFGLFKKKKKAPPSEPTASRDASVEAPQRSTATPVAPEMQALLDRWRAHQQAVFSRFDSVLEDARAGSAEMLGSGTTDFAPLEQAWTAIKNQLHRATDELGAGWDQFGDDLEDIDAPPEELIDRAAAEVDEGNTELEIRYETAYREVMAAAAHRMLEAAQATDSSSLSCASCGALMDKLGAATVALNVACGYCNAVNTIEPGPAIRAFVAAGARRLAEERALPAWQRMTRAETAIHGYRDNKDVPVSLLEEYDSSSREYWTTLREVEAELVPEQRQYVAMKVEADLKSAGKLLKQFWQWRERSA